MDEDNDVINLAVRGQSFLVSLSTLLSANDGCSYFNARFRPDSMLDAGLIRVDEEGRNVYEIDRDPFLFQHVMEYLVTNKLPTKIGSWSANKNLWSSLRDEAGYFGLDGLIQLLAITFSCSPDDEGGMENKGILYWLGTKKGTRGYLNPLERGAVWVEGNCDWQYKEEYHEGPDETEEKAYFFQYRPNLEGEGLTEKDHELINDSKTDKKKAKSIFGGGMGLFIFSGCDACRTGCAGNDHTIIKFKNGLAISPTHYSIRNAGCYGMSGDWNFAGSVDGGKTWMNLHRQRGKTKLYGGMSGGSGADEDSTHDMKLLDYVRGFEAEAREEAVCDYLEQHQRMTFKLDSPSADFFTHFRFTSVQTYTWDDRKDFCLHGIGFEIWGEVREEVGGQPSSDSVFARIDELESQTSKLRAENEDLQSRVKLLESKLKNQN